MNARTLHQIRHATNVTLVTGFTLAVLALFLSPFAFMVFSSLKTQGQMSVVGAPIWPASPQNIEYQGKQVGIYTVPIGKCEGFDPNDTSMHHLALVKKGRTSSTFVDPNDTQKGEFVCNVSWRALDRPWTFAPT